MQQIIPLHLQDRKKKCFNELLDKLIKSQHDALENVARARCAVKEAAAYFNEKRNHHEYHRQDT